MNHIDRPKVKPLRLKDLLSDSDESIQMERPLTDRKRVEPMRIKDLIKSLSVRKKPESASYTYPSKSADNKAEVTRKSTITSTKLGTNARRKLYSTQNTPHDVSRQSRLMSTSKTQPKPIKGINRNPTSKKSLLLPPNTIKESYIRKRQSEGMSSEVTYEDAAVQTDIELVQDASCILTKVTQSTSTCQCNTVKISENLSFFNAPSTQVKNNVNERSTNTDSENQFLTFSTVPAYAAYSTENRGLNDNVYSELQGTKPSIFVENDCGVYIQPLLANPILLQVPQNVENPKIIQDSRTVNFTNNSSSEHAFDKNNLCAIEEHLKEGIVRMTQALNLVQATMYSNFFLPQPQATVPIERENTVLCSYTPTPVSDNVISALSESLELMDIKIEPTYFPTTPNSFSTPPVSETDIKNQVVQTTVLPIHGMNTLQVRLEDCLNPKSKNILNETNGETITFQEISKEEETSNSALVQELPKSDQSNFNEQTTSESDKNLLRTPKRNSKNVESILSQTPKTKDRNSLMKLITPCKRTDNKENFQTPMSRRKSFSGLDSQNLRRSARIARHHLMHSLGEDSFIALERELDILYPRTNV